MEEQREQENGSGDDGEEQQQLDITSVETELRALWDMTTDPAVQEFFYLEEEAMKTIMGWMGKGAESNQLEVIITA